MGTTPAHTAAAVETFQRLTRPWLEDLPPGKPRWLSDITDDHSPFELSVSIEPGRWDVRMLVEAQDARMAEHQGWEPALALTERLAREPGVSLARFNQLRELFAPDHRVPARFALWHAAVVPPDGPVLYKLYLNPQILGPGAAHGMVREAFDVLGIPQAWPAVQDLLAVAAGRNELLYMALDLADTPDARVKVYVGHHGVRTAALEQQLALFPTYQPGSATWLTRQLTDSDGPFSERPVLTCLGFSDAKPDPDVTLHFPVRCYARDDEQVMERLARVLGEPSGDALARATAAYAGRSLDAGRGLVTYVSLRRASDESVRVVAYLSPEVYAVEPPREEGLHDAALAIEPTAPPRPGTGRRTLAAVLEQVAAREATLSQHPFIELLKRPEDVRDLGALAQGLTFFVMAFQDVLRLTAKHVTDPRLTTMARAHFVEDSGHEQWFLHDLRQLGLDPTVGFVFSSRHEIARDVGYMLVSEVLQATDDCDRMAVVFALEGAGHVFFEPAIRLFEKRRMAERLQYFARRHQQVESDHEIFEDDVQSTLAGIELTKDRFAEVLATVDRVFDALGMLADELIRQLTHEPFTEAQRRASRSQEHRDPARRLDDERL